MDIFWLTLNTFAILIFNNIKRIKIVKFRKNGFQKKRIHLKKSFWIMASLPRCRWENHLRLHQHGSAKNLEYRVYGYIFVTILLLYYYDLIFLSVAIPFWIPFHFTWMPYKHTKEIPTVSNGMPTPMIANIFECQLRKYFRKEYLWEESSLTSRDYHHYSLPEINEVKHITKLY